MASIQQRKRPNGNLYFLVFFRNSQGRETARTFHALSEAEKFYNEMGGGLRRKHNSVVDADYILSKIEENEVGCWLWTGSLMNEGYGRLTWKSPTTGKRTNLAHRVSYEIFNEPIPAGKELDHLCRVRRCINPTHLEPVTHRENMMRSPIAIAASNAAKTHCPQGHEYSFENTSIYRRPGYTMRSCKTCMATYARQNRERISERKRQRYAEKKAARKAQVAA